MDEEQIALQMQAIREQAVSILRQAGALVKQVDAMLGRPHAEPKQQTPSYMGAEENG